MSWLASFCLSILHVVYWLATTLKSIYHPRVAPQPLDVKRKQAPSHLALLLVPSTSDADLAQGLMLECVDRVAAWCVTVGIPRLTVYDQQGLLAQSSLDVRARLMKRFHPSSEEDPDLDTDIEYPLTPPPSDDAESRSLSPSSESESEHLNVMTIILKDVVEKPQRKPQGANGVVRRRRNSRKEPKTYLTVHIISRRSGKPAISCIANSDLRRQLKQACAGHLPPRGHDHYPAISEATISDVLEGQDGFPSPDLMLVHHLTSSRGDLPMELHGFPPWQLRLTEFCQSHWRRHPRSSSHVSDGLIDEIQFRQALDAFAGAEMRLGK